MSSKYVRRSVLVVCACLLVLAGCAADTPEQMIASAKSYLAKDDAKSASLQLRNVLQKNPNNAEARYLLGRALLETEEFASAEKELRKALELGYPADAVNPVLAQVLVGRGEFKDVIDAFSQSQGSTPRETAELKTAVGQAQLAMRQRDAALQAFKDAEAADPHYGPAMLGEARIVGGGGDLAGALARTDAALALVPSSVDGWQLKGDILTAQSQLDGAIAAYRKALEIRRSYVPAHAGLVSALLQKGDLAAATQAVATMKEIAPKSPQPYYLEALVLTQQKKFKEAQDAIQKELQLAPNEPRGDLLAARIDYELQSYAQVDARLSRILRQNPNHDYARRLLTDTYLRTGKPAKALETLKPILGRSDKDPALLNLAGSVYLQSGDPATAATYFDKALSLDPQNVGQRTGLALAHLAEGQDEQGERELHSIAATDEGIRADLALISASMQRRQFDKALVAIDALEKKQPDKPLAHNLRGLALMAKKDTAGARKSFERALQIDPNFFAATANLARLDLAENNKAAARQRFEALVAKNPANTQALLALAELKARDNATAEEVAGLISKAIAANPSEVGPRLALVGHYLRAKEPKKAVAAAQDATAAIPRRPEILEALARAQAAAGDNNQALATYNRLAELMPDAPSPLLNIAELQASQKDYDGAVKTLRRALAVQPDLVNAQRGVVALDMLSDRMPEALAMAREVQKQRPKEAVGYILEGDIHARKKAWNEALAAYRTGLKQTGSSEAAIRVHMALVASGQSAEAEKTATAWLKEHSGDGSYRVYLAEAASRRGDYATAMQHYGSLLDKYPNNAVLLNNFAWVAGRANDPRALEYAEKANQIAPDQAPIMDTLGVLLVNKGDQRGIELLRKATELSPNSPNIRLNLARALVKVGNKDAAKKELDELAKLGDKYAGQSEVTRLKSSL